MKIDLVLKIKEITRKPLERAALLRELTLPEQSAVLQELTPHIQQALLLQLKDDEIANIVDHLDPRLAEKIISRVRDEKRRVRIIKRVKTEAREKIEYFLRFHPKATTSLISFNYVLVPINSTVGDAADAIEEHYHDTGTFPEIFVQEGGKLVGEVPMSVLVRQRKSLALKKFIQIVQTITYRAEVIEIIDTLTASQRKKIIVLDHDDSVLGVIYADDVLNLFGKMPSESLYGVSGLDENERPLDSAWKKFSNRSAWLVLNLMTAFLAGSMIFLFSDTLDALVILAMYIPIVAGMGGNAGSQTFAVMLRGITLGTISLKNGWPAIKNEVIAGFYNGLLIGLIVAVISLLWNQSAVLGLVVGLSMVGVHMVAGLAGAFVPLFLKHLGKDPAATSTIFITTATDVLGLFFLLGLGTLLMM